MIEIFQQGGPVMYPLLACSIIALTVTIERLLFWGKIGRQSDRSLLDTIMGLAHEADWEAIHRKTTGSQDYVIRVLVCGILHRDYSMAKAMESQAADEIVRMRRFMGVLDTMITVAPLLGILGTVLGIIHSFNMLAGTGIDHPRLVTGGIAQALITTAAGLSIAILCVFPYNYFNSRIEQAALAMEKYATSLEIIFEKRSNGDESKDEGRHEA